MLLLSSQWWCAICCARFFASAGSLCAQDPSTLYLRSVILSWCLAVWDDTAPWPLQIWFVQIWFFWSRGTDSSCICCVCLCFWMCFLHEPPSLWCCQPHHFGIQYIVEFVTLLPCQLSHYTQCNESFDDSTHHHLVNTATTLDGQYHLINLSEHFLCCWACKLGALAAFVELLAGWKAMTDAFYFSDGATLLYHTMKGLVPTGWTSTHHKAP